MALLGTFGIFASSFVVRPVGGVIWGHYGDRLGRKRVLALTIILMSIATFLIAFIPGYASIGVAAPILLLVLRLVQGFSAAGEYADAASFIAEYAPDNRRGLLVSMVPASHSYDHRLAGDLRDLPADRGDALGPIWQETCHVDH